MTESESLNNMREMLIFFVLFVLATTASSASIENHNEVSNFDDALTSQLEQEFIRNISLIMNESEERKKQTKKKIKDMLKQPQIPPVNGDPIAAVQSRIPCECKNGICSCCLGGFFFNNKGCMKIKYIPEDFAFELRMTFNDNTLYKNTMSGKNPRPICISPPRFDRWLELCARFHDIYFVGRNMHLCLDISATLGDFDLIDRLFVLVKIFVTLINVIFVGNSIV